MNTAAAQHFHDFSPDGRWMVYMSNESGSFQVYLTSFPELAGKWQVSPNGGRQPQWSADGTELYFRYDGKIWSVAVETTETAVRLGKPEPVVTASNVDLGFVGSWSPAPDGKRWVIFQKHEEGDGQAPTNLMLVLNWFEELQRMAPAQ